MRCWPAALFAFGLNVFLSQVAGGQDLLHLTFRVSDAAGKPVADVRIVAEGNSVNIRTDSEGQARVSLSRAGGVLIFRKIGFAEERRAIPSTSREFRISLQRVATLDTVRVAAERGLPLTLERRRASGAGTHFGPSDLEAVNSVRALIGRDPQVRFEGTGPMIIQFRHPKGGTCWPDVYVDGRLSAPAIGSLNLDRLSKLVKFEELDTYSPDALYAIEIYPRGSKAPQGIVHLRDGCGVILAWTKSWAERELDTERRRVREARPVGQTPE